MIFSYDLAVPLVLPQSTASPGTIHWHIMEKGSIKMGAHERYSLTYASIRIAGKFLRNFFNTLQYQEILSLRSEGYNIVLKRELLPFQSVKERGILYTFSRLTEEQRRIGVITISTGNFAYMLCYYGNKFNVPVVVVMPTLITNDCVKKCQDTGSKALVLLQGKDMIEAHYMALQIARTNGLYYIDGNDHPNMIIGQATLGFEIADEIDAVILPTSLCNCGLTTGIATAIKETKPEIQVIEVLYTGNYPLFGEIRRQTMYNKLGFPVMTYPFRQPNNVIFNYRISIPCETLFAAVKMLEDKEHVKDYHAAIGIAAFVSGQLYWLKGKKVLIPAFGVMDSIGDFVRNIKKLSSLKPRADLPK